MWAYQASSYGGAQCGLWFQHQAMVLGQAMNVGWTNNGLEDRVTEQIHIKVNQSGVGPSCMNRGTGPRKVFQTNEGIGPNTHTAVLKNRTADVVSDERVKASTDNQKLKAKGKMEERRTKGTAINPPEAERSGCSKWAANWYGRADDADCNSRQYDDQGGDVSRQQVEQCSDGSERGTRTGYSRQGTIQRLDLQQGNEWWKDRSTQPGKQRSSTIADGAGGRDSDL
ncbi:hypothetical protein F0562_034448 [Nyssa sinensis]|uniref:Uncharacterized protein n=1 Tax=Nyssa sinensis TaxID=561372 RepID=A0A5J5AIG9_9ASTE|nr:hypothetical protein F0562_034448 [Nyssa sinensis]